MSKLGTQNLLRTDSRPMQLASSDLTRYDLSASASFFAPQKILPPATRNRFPDKFPQIKGERGGFENWHNPQRSFPA